MNKNLFEEIADFIVANTQDNSLETGFQYITNFSEMEEKFSIKIDEHIKNKVHEELEQREEIADVQLDEDGFDVVLYTDYAPNYNEEDYE